MRLFIATNFPAGVLGELNDRVAKVRPRLPAAAWVRQEAQHLTLAFLGDQRESCEGAVTPPLLEAFGRVPAFEARLRGCGFFPNARHARVAWIGLEPEERFVGLAGVARRVVTEHGVTLDSSEFKPHLTLLRVRDSWPPASAELFIRSLRDYESAPFLVDQATLFSSELHPRGAIHTARQQYPFANPT